jgi:hypothetical protein
VKKLILLAVGIVLAGCSRGPAPTVAATPAPAPVPTASAPAATTTSPAPATNVTGSSTAALAISEFMAAAKAQNLQAMGALWGSTTELVRERDAQADVEKRLLIMACHLKHDAYKVTTERPDLGGTRMFQLQLTYKDITRVSSFRVVPNQRGRWFVQEFELEPLQAICAKS